MYYINDIILTRNHIAVGENSTYITLYNNYQMVERSPWTVGRWHHCMDGKPAVIARRLTPRPSHFTQASLAVKSVTYIYDLLEGYGKEPSIQLKLPCD